MSTDKHDDTTEFARQEVERGVLNEIVTEEQRQRQEIESLVEEWRKTLKPGLLTELGLRAERQRHECAEQLAAILQR